MDKGELREKMERYLETPEVMDKMTGYMQEKNIAYEELQNDTLVEMLDHLGLLDSIMADVDSELPTDVSYLKRSLKVNIQQGRSFSGMAKYPNCQFIISLCFLHQRVQSRPIKCQVEPRINETFQLKIDKANMKLEELRNIELSIVVLEGDHKIVYAIKEIDWRFVLAFGSISFDIELSAYKEQNTSAGILHLKLDLSPRSSKDLISERLLNNQFQLQKKTKEKVNNEFYQYATQFWNDYKSIHPTFVKRSVPIYRQSEDGIYVHVPKYVHPLYNARGIDSPFHALRFVSLIPRQEEVINSKSLCKRFHTLLSSGKGTTIDHCHLLCSLLLGFGLNAYVCTGYSAKGEHSWVMVFGKKENIVWQTTNGLKFPIQSEKGSFYKMLNTVYNHEQFYANIQMNEMIGAVTFDFQNSSRWKSVPAQKIRGLMPFNQQVSFMYPTINTFSLQERIQSHLLESIAGYRKQYKLQTKNDQKLSSILSIALSNYEYERITEQTFGEKEFQEAIRNYIPERHTFRAFPIQLQESNPEKILNILKANKMSNDILLSRGDSVFLALKAKVIAYPDDFFVVWLSLASRYYKLL